MSELSRQVVLAIVTAAVAALILVPTFIVLKLLLDAGLEVVFVVVVVFGFGLVYLLHRETTR